MKTCEEMYQDIQPMIAGGRHEEAVRALEKVVESFPDFAQSHNDLGILYHKIGNKEKALVHFRQAVALEPGTIFFLKNLADFCYAEMGEVKEALTYYEKILNIKPDDIDALMISGHILVAEHKFDEAKVFYQKVLDHEPWNDEAWNYLQKLEAYSGSGADETHLEDAYHRCQDLANSGKIDEAIHALETIIQTDADFAPAYNDLGVLHYHQGNKEKVFACYEKAALLDPSNITYQKNLADFYYVEMGRIEDALEIYAKVLSEEPADVECLLAAGHISELLNLSADAKIFYDRVLDIEPWNLEASDKMAELSENLMPKDELTVQGRILSTEETFIKASSE